MATQEPGSSGAHALVGALARAGITAAFGVPGPHNLPVVAELRRAGLRFVSMQRPEDPVIAADGHVRRTGRPALALTGPGPSSLPALPALREAHAQGTPVVLVDVAPTPRPVAVRPGDAVPEPDVDEALKTLDLRAVHVLRAGDDVTTVVRELVRRAVAAPGGPVVLHATQDFLHADVALPAEDAEQAGEPESPAPAPAGVEHVQLRRAANLVDDSQNLLIWAGGGALRAGASGAIAELAEKVGAPVVTTVHAAGLLPARHPCLVGLPPQLPGVGALWDAADLIVAIGTDFDDESTQAGAQPAPNALIAINVDPINAGRTYRPDVLLRGDARVLTKALADTVGYRGGTAVIRSRMDELRSAVRSRLASEEAGEAAFLDAVSTAIPDRATVVADTSAGGRWLAAFHEWTLPRTLLSPSDLEATAWALPAAIGAASTGSTEPVVLVLGDQGFLASTASLAPAAREKLPLTILVVDDGGSGRLRPLLPEVGLDPSALDRPAMDHAALARSFGLRADTVDEVGPELTDALRAHIAAPDPTVLVVRTRLQLPPTARERWYRSGHPDG